MLKFNFRKLAAAAFVAVAIFFQSCQTVKKGQVVEPIDLLNPDASLYVYVPVKSHPGFVKHTIRAITGAGDADAEKIVKRTDSLFIANSAVSGAEISAKGDFPSSLMKFALTEKKGWKQQSYDNFAYYEHTPSRLQFALPTSDLVCLSYKAESMLDRYKSKLFAEDLDSVSVVAPEINDFLTAGNSDEIRFYSRVDGSLFQNFLDGSSLSIKYITGKLVALPDTEMFDLTLVLELSDVRTIKAACAMLRLALLGSPAKIVQSADTKITVTGLTLSWNDILKMFSGYGVER